MINKSTIGEIIFDECRRFGVDVRIKENIPFGELKEERIVIIPGRIQGGRYWLNSTVKVNWCVPDIGSEENSLRIKEVERELEALYRGIGDYEGRYYIFRRESTDTARDSDIRCHYANLTLSFKIQNTL